MNNTGETAEPLPQLSPSERRAYNRLAEHMDSYHNHFRYEWNRLYDACRDNKRPAGVSIRRFIDLGLNFCQMVTMHHSLEEGYVFPLLATKMSEFREELHLIQQHKQIHDGLSKLEDYLGQCRSGVADFQLQEVKVLMDSFGGVLWTHMDEEVQALGAENMMKFWTLEEMKGFSML